LGLGVRLQKLWYQTLIIVVGLAALGFGLGAIAIVYSQVAVWLRTAVWTPHTIAEQLFQLGLGYPYVQNWLGVQAIIDNVLGWPASLGDFLMAAGMFFTLGWLIMRVDAIRDAERAIQRKKEWAEKSREEIQEAASRSKSDFDFTQEIEEILGEKRWPWGRR
jgi:hypothetical protein